jgi:hypothetical protein
MHRKCLFLFLVYAILAAGPAFAAAEVKVPEPLKPWVDWVLHDHQEELLCTANYNDANDFRCNWPTALALDIRTGSASFRQKWLLEHESWIQLPGNAQLWPRQVTINGKPALILKRNGAPQVKLPAGAYRISGSFTWQTMPEFLQINPQTGLLTLTVNDQAVPFPSLDDTGRVWLHSRGTAEKVIEDSLRIQAFRMIIDQIPAQVVLQLNLDVAGAAREVLLGAPFSAREFTPLSLNSSLPARLEKDGRIRVQIRPGQWQLTLTARHIGPLASLNFARPDDAFRPRQEVWVFAKENHRIVEIEGVTAIDPQQTALPGQWRNLPAYRIMADETMTFKEIKRGDPRPAPDQLRLERSLWLRFDGSGYTIQDRITGKKTANWRLEMTPPLILGRVAIAGAEQFITRMADSPNSGIELRNGLIDITADGEYRGGIRQIPATGWDQDFQQVGALLNLPPGYRLLHATGIDNVPATWLNRWTLLDLFVLLIFTIALAKLYSRPLALSGFITMALLYHEPGAPRWIWLAILIGVALVRIVPEGRFRQGLKIYHALAFLLLIIIAIPFSVNQLRVGIYPQLEKPWQIMGRAEPPRHAAPMVSEEKRLAPEVDIVRQSAERAAGMEDRAVALLKSKVGSVGAGRDYARRQQVVAQYDPSMINQTGPGIPAWQWHTVRMSWSGPVERNQRIGLSLLGPKANLFLAFARVALMILLALGILGVRYGRAKGWRWPDPKTFLLLPLLLLPLLTPAIGRAAAIPSPELFAELQQRLLAKEDCFPNCADIPAMTIAISPSELAIEFTVAAQGKVAVPLPGHPDHWLASSVKIDSQPAPALYRTNQGLWLIAPPGRHTVSLGGTIPPNDTLQLSLPLKPHSVQIRPTGWTTTGTHRDGAIDNQLHFQRIVKQATPTSRILETGVLPPFVLVARTFQLGLDWRVMTTVSRVSPGGTAVTLQYPLLPGEAVVTAGVVVADGKARINLDPQVNYLSFESVLAKSDTLMLNHALTSDWTETWQVDASPIFHLEYEGIPVILHQIGNHWAPQWQPWPGEAVRLLISRPAGVPGQTITIDKSNLEIRPGQRATDAKLQLALRSSQGGQHTITLPPASQLQEVKINGQVQSLRQEGRGVVLPIVPGSQEIILQWRESAGITASYKTAALDLGLASVNTNIDLQLPTNRWPLLIRGPVIGPAILFWSVLLVIILVAFGLARSKLTHLQFHQLLLLGIGLSQSNPAGGLLVVGWLIALHYRRKVKPDLDHGTFNLLQLGLGALTVLALLALLFAISQGLLGHPDMNIVGNGSNRNLLRWYQDYSPSGLPRAWLLSIPLFWYRLAMLAWALWLSLILTRILRHGWQAFSAPVLWYPHAQKIAGRKAGRKDAGPEAEIDLTAEMRVDEIEGDEK